MGQVIMMKCPYCNQQHPDNTRFCPRTGMLLSLCPRCKRPVRAGARFCATCGQSLPRPTHELRSSDLIEAKVRLIEFPPSKDSPDKPPFLPPQKERLVLPDTPAQPEVAPKEETKAPASRPEPSTPEHKEKPRLPHLHTNLSAPMPMADEYIPASEAKPISYVAEEAAVTPPTQEKPSAWTAIPTSPLGIASSARKLAKRARLGIILAAVLGVAVIAGLVAVWLGFRRGGLPVVAENTATDTEAVALVIASPIASPTRSATPTQAAPAPTRAEPTSLPTPSPLPSPIKTTPAPTKQPTAIQSPSPTLALVSPPPAGTALEYDLAFFSDRDGRQGIYLMDADNPTNWFLVPLPEGYEIVAWPTFCGESLAFEADDRSMGLRRWIFLYELASGAFQPLIIPEEAASRVASPGCSRSGHYMAYAAYNNPNWSLQVADLSSGQMVFEDPASKYPLVGNATWSSIDTSFVWMGTRDTGYTDVNRTANFLSSSTARTDKVLDGKYPAISPDGKRLAYYCGNLLDLCVVEWPSGKSLYKQPINYYIQIKGQLAAASASWSGDGQWIYFVSSAAGSWDIYRMHPDGSDLQNLTEAWKSNELMPASR
jgi:Tol biopolymer transport system component